MEKIRGQNLMEERCQSFKNSHIVLIPPNTIIFDWVESAEKKWEQGNRGDGEGYRQCEVAWLYPSEEIQKELIRIARVASIKSNWFFDIKRIEPLQYTVYNEGGFYDWHIDTDQYHFSGEVKGLRKLSMTMFLNDDFEGGNLQLEFGRPNTENRLLNFHEQTGSMIFFPSLTWHRVAPVTKGVRKTLVVWFLADYG